jgi:bis(5'-nucleosidyl)-tetraphosphatase
MKKEVSAGVIIFNQDDGLKFLFLFKHKQNRQPYWDFAKGKVDNEESFKKTAIRETEEETGLRELTFDDWKYEVNYKFTNKKGELVDKYVHFFLAESKDTNVIISKEHEDYAWLTYDETMDKLIHEDAKQLVTKAFKHILEKQKG